jgi:hypothetical protein
MVLTEIEKLDASHPNLVIHVKGWLDEGKTSEQIPELLHQTFGVSVTSSMVKHFRSTRWATEKRLIALKLAITKAAVEAFGGDSGFDSMLLAKLWEMMDKMTIPQLIAARTLFVRIKAQNLKEQEFLFKTGQLKPPKPADEEDADPHAQSRKALQRIKEIFGLAGDEPPKPPVRQIPAAAGSESGQAVVNVEPVR